VSEENWHNKFDLDQKRFVCLVFRNTKAPSSVCENFSKFFKPTDEEKRGLYPNNDSDAWWGRDEESQLARSLALLFMAEMEIK